jgi:hypothetical protein
VILAGNDPTVVRGVVVLDHDDGPVDVLMRLPGLAAEARWNHERPLVPFAALGDAAPAFIRSWFELYENLGPAMLFFIAALSERMFLENRLLNDMSFAESYHRTLHDKPPITPDEHTGYMARMLDDRACRPSQALRGSASVRGRPRSATTAQMAHQARKGHAAEANCPESRTR